jgi:hypothetical protein
VLFSANATKVQLRKRTGWKRKARKRRVRHPLQNIEIYLFLVS